MATIQLFFILIFIVVQGALGLLLLYRGFTLTLENIDTDRLKNGLNVAITPFKKFVPYITWRRLGVLILVLAPGSIPLLLVIALWRVVRNYEPGMLSKLSTRRLKTALQNIAL
ncbi:MAG: hypothetical protein AB1489_19930 [Acidobacteriota bacterium]